MYLCITMLHILHKNKGLTLKANIGKFFIDSLMLMNWVAYGKARFTFQLKAA